MLDVKKMTLDEMMKLPSLTPEEREKRSAEAEAKVKEVTDRLFASMDEIAEIESRLDESILELLREASERLSHNDYKKLLYAVVSHIEEHGIIETRKALAEALGGSVSKPEELTFKSFIPMVHIKPNNKLSQEIVKGLVDDGGTELNVGGNSKKKIIAKVMLAYEGDNINLSGRAKFTPYDREVQDAITTLWEAGNNIFTASMVYRAMNGMTEGKDISPQAKGAVTKSIEKARRIMVNIDFTQEARAYKKECDSAKYEDYLLACGKITVKAGGTIQEAYTLPKIPILYQYAKVTGQIISVPISLLQTSDSVRNTEEVIVIRGHLLRAIEGMKSPKFKRSNKIAFDTLYEHLGILPSEYTESMYKKKTHDTRKHTKAILNEWKRQGYIKDYSLYAKGKTIKGIDVTY